MKIYVLVEGHGEVQAVPVLLRRLLAESRCYGIRVGPRLSKLTFSFTLISAHTVERTTLFRFPEGEEYN